MACEPEHWWVHEILLKLLSWCSGFFMYHCCLNVMCVFVLHDQKGRSKNFDALITDWASGMLIPHIESERFRVLYLVNVPTKNNKQVSIKRVPLPLFLGRKTMALQLVMQGCCKLWALLPWDLLLIKYGNALRFLWILRVGQGCRLQLGRRGMVLKIAWWFGSNR